MKALWGLLFAASLLLYTLIFFGAASGGSNNPPMMYGIWAAVLVGVGCGALTVVKLVSGANLLGVDWLIAIIALWPLVWLLLAIAKNVLT